MEQYISDYRAPRTPAPIFPTDKERDRYKGKDGKGGKKLATDFRRRSRTQEESIEKGETIDADWETWQAREDRIKRECEKKRRQILQRRRLQHRRATSRRPKGGARHCKIPERKVAVTEAAKEATNYPPSSDRKTRNSQRTGQEPSTMYGQQHKQNNGEET